MNDSPRRAVHVEDLAAIKTVTSPQLSPDGSCVAYALLEVLVADDRYRSTVWVVPARGGDPRQLTRGSRRDFAPRWSPDGQSLVFLSDRDGEPAQLYLIPADGGEAHRLTALDHGAGRAVWSPDGRRIAFSARVPNE